MIEALFMYRISSKIWLLRLALHANNERLDVQGFCPQELDCTLVIRRFRTVHYFCPNFQCRQIYKDVHTVQAFEIWESFYDPSDRGCLSIRKADSWIAANVQIPPNETQSQDDFVLMTLLISVSRLLVFYIYLAFTCLKNELTAHTVITKVVWVELMMAGRAMEFRRWLRAKSSVVLLDTFHAWPPQPGPFHVATSLSKYVSGLRDSAIYPSPLSSRIDAASCTDPQSYSSVMNIALSCLFFGSWDLWLLLLMHKMCVP